MPFRRLRGGEPQRREATSFDSLVRGIASDNARQRFKPTPPGTERPRDVFMSAADAVLGLLASDGWRYARSGPHVSKRFARLKAKIVLASSHRNVAGELVIAHATVLIADPELADWRRSEGLREGRDDTLVERHVGHLLEPPAWLDWNLADAAAREATIRDMADSVSLSAVPYVERVVEAVGEDEIDHAALGDLLDPVTRVELLVRHGHTDSAVRLTEAMLRTYRPRVVRAYVEQVDEMRRSGPPDAEHVQRSDKFAVLTVRFGLDVDLTALRNWLADARDDFERLQRPTHPTLCLVCGYDYTPLARWPWGESGDVPSGDRCVCCGVVFGAGDSTLLGARYWRQQWRHDGMLWADERYRPPLWDAGTQLDQLPDFAV